MADDKQKMTLTKLGENTYGDNKKKWVTSDGKQGFVIFDGELAKMFNEKELAGKELEYIVQPAKQQGHKPVIIGIVGHYAPQGRGKGGFRGGGGPMFSNEQVALNNATLLVASGRLAEGLLELTHGRMLKLLGGGSGTGAQAKAEVSETRPTTERPPAKKSAAKPYREGGETVTPDPAKPPPAPTRDEVKAEVELIKTLAAEKNYALSDKLLEKHYESPWDLPDADRQKLLAYLKGL